MNLVNRNRTSRKRDVSMNSTLYQKQLEELGLQDDDQVSYKKNKSQVIAIIS